jgi:hypothetical protein
LKTDLQTPLVTVLPGRTARVLGGMALALVVIDIATQCAKYLLGYDHMRGMVGLFDVDDERNIPTLFSVCLLAIAAMLLTLIARLKRQHGEGDVVLWMILSIGFFAMAVDEGWAFHEKLGPPVRALFKMERGHVLYYAWIVPGALFVALIALSYLRFMRRLPPATRRAFIVSACLYLGGALGMEAAGGAYAARHGIGNLAYAMFSAAEESLEMAGSISFIHALLEYIAGTYGEIRFRVESGRA